MLRVICKHRDQLEDEGYHFEIDHLGYMRVCKGPYCRNVYTQGEFDALHVDCIPVEVFGIKDRPHLAACKSPLDGVPLTVDQERVSHACDM